MGKIKHFLFVWILSAPLVVQAFSLNDLSVLLPLPKDSLEERQLLAPGTVGVQGTLLSRTVFQRFIPLVPEQSNDELWNHQLRVLGIRLDPCFFEGVGPVACRPQVRLVWQPVIESRQSFTTRDAAIHSFYEFDAATFADLLRNWKSLSSGSTEDALQVHPQIKKQGLHGVHWKALRSIILKYCGDSNLVRMTMMNVMANEQLWIFSGFDINQGQEKEIIIPRVGGITHAVTQSSFQFQSFTGGMTPEPQGDKDFSELVSDSYYLKKKYSEDQVRALVQTIIGYENPRKHNTATLDCASCHLANMTHQWAQKNYPQFRWDQEFKSVTYTSSWNLENTTRRSVLQPNQLRAFGYFGAEPAISQRVIHETAETATRLKNQR